MDLHHPAFHPVSVQEIEPTGWLARQLQIQLEGLSGNLDTFWPDIKDSAWIGGEAEGWERMPYWLDGVIPLAWLTGDARLQERIKGYLDHILTHQHEDGWLGPRPEEKPEAEDVWSQALALKMLVEYFDATSDPRVPVSIEKNLRMMDHWIDKRPLHKWGQFRWFEFLVALYWLYERTEEDWLKLAVKLRAQGFGWKDFFAQWPLTEATEKGRWNFAGHVVNNAMAVKESGLVWRLTGELGDRDAAHRMIAQLDEHHGMPTGVFTGDECLAGTSPVQGTELCAVAEYMYSLEHLVGVFGEVTFADRLERIAFNALPATFSPDMWAHQYDQQVNQIECSVKEDRTFNTNRGDANLYGLEPHFGCCTANLSQAWPKFAKHLWMRTEAGGIVAAAYAPSKLSTKVEDAAVEVVMQTDYPFRDEIKLEVKAEEPVRFALHLRIPEWAESPKVSVDGEPVHPAPGTFLQIEREWNDVTEVKLTLPAQLQVLKRPEGRVSVVRGPLVFALNIEDEWKRINADDPMKTLPHGDWEVYARSPWNYALDLNAPLELSHKAFGDPIFSPDGAPVAVYATGRRLKGWNEENGSAASIPESPVETKEKPESLTLIPYGCTNLRIGEFPVVKE
jgi:hypothetical protein